MSIYCIHPKNNALKTTNNRYNREKLFQRGKIQRQPENWNKEIFYAYLKREETKV